MEDRAGLACSKLTDLTPEFLDSSHGIWLKSLAYLVLSRREREIWEGMHNAVPKRRRDWLLGRCAAKDAVRMLLKERLGLELCAADVEIVTGPSGRPTVEGLWKQRAGVQPAVSISHSNGVAAALAAFQPDRLLGIDIEFLGRSFSPFETSAFNDEERQCLEGVGDESLEEWSLRLWCAKEAVAKALGQDLASVFGSVRVAGAEKETGIVRLALVNGQPGAVHGETILAYTRREGDLISSAIFCPAGAVR
jgi:phosphopantetheinyl transferase